jgi:hypothetical protein
MVAVIDSLARNGHVPVTIVAGEEASGLANIVGQYLEQVLGDSPEKRLEAAALRGSLGLLAREGDVAITIVFGDDGIAILEGLQQPDAVISGEVEALMHILAGHQNPVIQAFGRTVGVRPALRRPLFGYAAYHVMRLPGVHVWSGVPRKVVVGAGGAVALGVVLLVYRSRRRARGDAHG